MEKTATGSKRTIVYYNILNILAAFSVVWIHFGNEIHWYDGSVAWKMCVFIQVAAYWAVPVFFMLTGATLLNYRDKYDTKTFFKRRFLRGVAPYFIWGTIMLIYRWNMLAQGVTGLKQKLALIVNSYINNSMEPIYWFFLPLTAIYLAMPVLSLLSKKENRKILDYTLVVGIISISVLPFMYNCFQYIFNPQSGYSWNGMWNLPVVGGYAIYPLLGYWASTHDFTPKQRYLVYGAGLAGAVVRFTGIWFLSARDGAVPHVFMDYLSIPAVALALAVWVFVRYGKWSEISGESRLGKCLAEIAKCGLGVYVMHILVLEKMMPIAFFGRYTAMWYYFWPIITYLFCVLVVYVARRVPVVKWLFP